MLVPFSMISEVKKTVFFWSSGRVTNTSNEPVGTNTLPLDTLVEVEAIVQIKED